EGGGRDAAGRGGGRGARALALRERGATPHDRLDLPRTDRARDPGAVRGIFGHRAVALPGGAPGVVVCGKRCVMCTIVVTALQISPVSRFCAGSFAAGSARNG